MRSVILVMALAMAAPVWAEDLSEDLAQDLAQDLAMQLGPDTEVSEQGTLNPHEMSMAQVMESIRNGDTGMVICSQGYLVTKSGRHEMARELFKSCADHGWTGAMTWMSQLDDRGLGGPQDLAAAAEWNRKAAEAGDPVGKFNHGLDLMRGWGVARDEAAGRAMVDEAARDGLDVAQRLQSAQYDLDEVTPDADEWRYLNLF
ncbi:MAG: sel1 repeat family protein [Alphaproteobacteria bacterium]|nr:sel1 repeat family protein [Alphaproteobacteria bacterium]MBU1278989.1 sel1 repeat family protein [Alphaproteobacteria bacterium]MBU1573054.1 sel1 repeat family protein [Alphaproteobacteria bacterium]MBU1826934.1 sel1 repeat family protein [Alphaproteobacteria bacterium]MBU2080054.1 sel1 repeat family protein [Alphaproteobacteria bacterium]